MRRSSDSQFKVKLKAEFQGSNHDVYLPGGDCGEEREVISVARGHPHSRAREFSIMSMTRSKSKSCSGRQGT
jgi:hypothetical protein